MDYDKDLDIAKEEMQGPPTALIAIEQKIPSIFTTKSAVNGPFGHLLQQAKGRENVFNTDPHRRTDFEHTNDIMYIYMFLHHMYMQIQITGLTYNK